MTGSHSNNRLAPVVIERPIRRDARVSPDGFHTGASTPVSMQKANPLLLQRRSAPKFHAPTSYLATDYDGAAMAKFRSILTTLFYHTATQTAKLNSI